MELHDTEDGHDTRPEERDDRLADFARREVKYEIIDGEFLELPPMSAPASDITFLLGLHLANYGIASNRGLARTEMLIKLSPTATRNRRPDVIFVSFSLWPKTKAIPNVNAWEILPELCIEVLSPTDRMEDILTRIIEFFEAGVQQVWIVSPTLQFVQVYRAISLIEVFTRDQSLQVTDLLPGFSLSLAELFPVFDQTSTSWLPSKVNICLNRRIGRIA